MPTFQRSLLLLIVLLLSGPALAQAQGPRVVLFEDPDLGPDRLHYPLLISEGRGYRISCARQEDEEAVIRGLGFTTVPSEVLTAVDPDIVDADPGANPLLCPRAADYPIKVFAADGPEGLTHYLQFPSAFGSSTFTDRIYVPECVGLVDALGLDLSQALAADPTPFFAGKIHRIAGLDCAPIAVPPERFADWCTKGDRTPEETATVMAVLDATPQGVAALGNAAACAAADDFLGLVQTLDLTGKGVQSLAPLSVLGHLTQLSLADNEIVDLAPLASLRALTFLDLSANQIANVVALAPLTTLTRLDLADNQIGDVRFLSALTLLTSLTLDGNAVADLAPLRFLQALGELSVAANGLTGEMLEPLTALGALTSLDVSDNEIASFAHLGDFPSTVQIDLTGNPIASGGSSSFLDVCILHRDAATPFGQTLRAIVDLHGGGTCSEVNDAVLASATLDLAGKSLTDVSPLSVLRHLTTLDLSGNAIGDVAPLSVLTSLVDLNLADNNVTDIRPIGPLTALTAFEATGNPVAVDDFLSACLMRHHEDTLTETQTHEVDVLLEISLQTTCQEAFDVLIRRTQATAQGRGLSTIDYFDVLRSVRHLNLMDNQLTDVSVLSGINSLTHLELARNQIGSLSAVTPLRQLEVLSLEHNPLPSLNGIQVLAKLKRLFFSNTQVRSVQPLSSLPLLEQARMRGLALSYATFAEYCTVQRFDPIALGSERNFMAAVQAPLTAANVDPDDCQAVEAWARSVASLNLNKKGIASVQPIVFFTALRELYLYDNLIRDAHPIGRLRQLRKLNLNSNRLTSVPHFQSLQLEYLYLGENDIASINNLSNLNRLKTLNLFDNKVQNPSAVSRISSLTFLDLRQNRIGNVTAARSVLPRAPYLKGNPVCQLRIHVPGLADACRKDPPLIVIPTFNDRLILDNVFIDDTVNLNNLLRPNRP